jgi:hypothetical protein
MALTKLEKSVIRGSTGRGVGSMAKKLYSAFRKRKKKKSSNTVRTDSIERNLQIGGVDEKTRRRLRGEYD